MKRNRLGPATRRRSGSLPVSRSRSRVRLGFIPLIDAAPLIAAQELGLFARHGLHVQLQREIGWATIKERLCYGELDGAHALAGMAFAIKLGISCIPVPVVSGMVLNLNGNAITISKSLWNKGVRDVTSLRQLVRSEAPRKFTFGVVSSVSSHLFLLRRWLKSGGIDPERDVRIVTLPPPQMIRSLQADLVQGYCVGEPWTSVAVLEQTGWCAATSQTLCPGHPEKVLLVTQDFDAQRGHDHLALIAALREACAWCDYPAHRAELVDMLAPRRYLNLDPQALRQSLIGPFDRGDGSSEEASLFHVFHAGGANRPTFERASWVLEEMRAARILPDDFRDFDNLARRVFREDLYEASFGQVYGPAS
jgi:ABC-type nitrate/sulfonate/bicarbonate transport system substrate-binding protein